MDSIKEGILRDYLKIDYNQESFIGVIIAKKLGIPIIKEGDVLPVGITYVYLMDVVGAKDGFYTISDNIPQIHLSTVPIPMVNLLDL